jgi:Methane oxygenase PmoA
MKPRQRYARGPAIAVTALVALSPVPSGAPADRIQPEAAARAPLLPVTVTADEPGRRVDVTIGGQPFTSYIWPERLKKPVLYPLRSAKGTLVTRGWPLDPRPGERIDHPHHVGLWFDYGNVNGIDFWNNSDALTPAAAAKMGTILHRRVISARGGAESGSLVTDADWIGPGGVTLLNERSECVFRGDATARIVERTTTLTALDRRVVFNDNKEGLFGMRVARQLEQPSTTPEVFTDASGRATAVPALDNTGVSGQYLSSEGRKGDAVWGTRGRWTMLTGRIGAEALTLAMLDHPKNPGFPTYWHARGYGLFAANPLGPGALTDGKQAALNLTLEPQTSATFRYRLLILEGTAAAERLDRESSAFAAEQTSSR